MSSAFIRVVPVLSRMVRKLFGLSKKTCRMIFVPTKLYTRPLSPKVTSLQTYSAAWAMGQRKNQIRPITQGRMNTYPMESRLCSMVEPNRHRTNRERPHFFIVIRQPSFAAAQERAGTVWPRQTTG